jgi:hypothetical protein
MKLLLDRVGGLLGNWAFWIMVLLALALSTGCATTGEQIRVPGTGTENNNRIEFIVENRNWNDARVYIKSHSGVTLGRISHAGSQATTHKFGTSPGQSFYFQIEFLASSDVYITEVIFWAESCVYLTIAPYLPNTSVVPCDG